MGNDLIFLDLNMPGYDGKKCLKHLKATESYQNIPVIIYSTFISQDAHDEMLRLGADHVVTKPGDFKSLQAAILKSLKSVMPST
jgi:CheY-like chemotaxis protein